MKHVICIGMDTADGTNYKLGYIGTVHYAFIKKAHEGTVNFRDRYGEVMVNKMFSTENKKKAKVYDTEDACLKEINFLRNEFRGLGYTFTKSFVNENEAMIIRNNRR